MRKETSETKLRIQESALHLFMKNGFDDTSINQIMRDAQLAKGTFYIYYKDKATLIEEIMITKNIVVLEALIDTAYKISEIKHLSWQHAFIKLLIQHHREHPQILRLISHSIHKLSTNVMKEKICKETARLPEFLQELAQEGEDEQTVVNRFFLILEVAGIVCYNAIYLHHPDDIQQIESLLYQHLCMDTTKGEFI